MYSWMVLEFMHFVSYISKISSAYLVQRFMFFVSSSCFKHVSSMCCRNVSAIVLEIGDPMETTFSVCFQMYSNFAEG